MMAFPEMLTEAAEKAGMKVPPDPDNYIPDEFPHFHVFCNVQLGRPLVYWGEHWDNAEIVAKIPEDKIKDVTLEEFIALGLHYAS